MASVESLQEALRVLAAERQGPRDRNAGRDALESNRLEVGRRRVSLALVDRHSR